MKERPILFKPRLVRAILDGKKTQTRRIVKPQPQAVTDEERSRGWRGDYWWPSHHGRSMLDLHEMPSACPYGTSGDRLWVREQWTHDADSLQEARAQHEDVLSMSPIYYRAGMSDGEAGTFPRWRPSLHMPRWASRLTLEVTDVRVELVQDISDADVLAEGCNVPMAAALTGKEWADIPSLWEAWHAVWAHVNGETSWQANPWVWVIGFKVVPR